MTTRREGLLSVDGARLHYKAVGSGPVLLMLPGGDGDADAFDLTTPLLCDRFTVVTYDRRGLSRSVLDEPGQAISIERHADDAQAILAAFGSEPADVFGGSIGALIGLALVARHPDRVRTLIAFEPPAPDLLPEEPRARAIRARESVQEALRAGGIAAAMQQYARVAQLNLQDREPDFPVVQPSAWRPANLQFFLTRDAPAVGRYHLPIEALRAAGTRVIAAAGKSSADAWPRQVAEALAQQLGCPLVEFAGDHAGFVTHPRALAASLRHVLGG